MHSPFESDSGKADMITGKVVANLQWSGDGCIHWIRQMRMIFHWNFAVPEEQTNIYFDGWVMLKSEFMMTLQSSRQKHLLILHPDRTM